jgi:hypothetical protein
VTLKLGTQHSKEQNSHEPSVWQGTVAILSRSGLKFSRVNNAHLKNSWHLPQLINKRNINISLIWTGRYYKNTRQPKFRKNIELCGVLADSTMISVNIKHCSSVGELLSEFPKLHGRTINSTSPLSRSNTHTHTLLWSNWPLTCQNWRVLATCF